MRKEDEVGGEQRREVSFSIGPTVLKVILVIKLRQIFRKCIFFYA